MSDIWTRLTQGRNTQQRELAPGDREGARLYLDFNDCLDAHKYTVFYGVAAVTIPWSYMKKSVGPFFIGVILSTLPDLIYANWRCDDKFKLFQSHCERVAAAMQQHQHGAAQQHQQQQQQLQQASAAAGSGRR